jgi:hypothetical protein
MVAIRNRPQVDFTASERRTEIAFLKDLKEAKKFSIYPARLKEVEQNLNDLYDLVEARYRNT